MRENFQRRVPKAMFRPTAAGVAAISVWVENGGTRISLVAGLARRFTNEIADRVGANSEFSASSGFKETNKHLLIARGRRQVLFSFVVANPADLMTGCTAQNA